MKKDLLIKISDLSIDVRKGLRILDNVSFEIKRGELVSLIGLNGSGKTTLLKAMVGLIPPTSGKVERFVENIFYIPQKGDLDTSFPLTVREFCELFGGENYDQYLKETGMSKFLKRNMGALSGGEYQRVLISLALSRKPDLLLLDEPTSGIDVAGEESFYKLIDQVREKHNISMMLVSHDIHLVMKNTDKVLCLAGHICCTGTPKEVEKDKNFQETFGKHLTPYVHEHDHVH